MNAAPNYHADRWVRYAHNAASAFTVFFTAAWGFLVVLIPVSHVARPERAGFACVLFAASLATGSIWWLLRQASRRHW